MKPHFLVAILFFVGSFSMSAQSIYYNHGHDNFLRLEINRPIFTTDFDVNMLSFDGYLNGEFRIGEKNKIAFEIPYHRFSTDLDLGSVSNFQINNTTSQLGNMAIAFQIRNLEHPNYFEFKLRLPTPEEINTFGINSTLTDYTERLTSFVPNIFSIEGSYSLESTNQLGLYYRFKPGLKFIIPTDHFSFNGELELLLDMNVLGGYRSEIFDINAGITTTSIITESDIDFSDRVLRQIFTTITFTGQSIRPGLMIRKSLGELSEGFYNIVIGFHIGYTFGSKSKSSQDMDPTTQR